MDKKEMVSSIDSVIDYVKKGAFEDACGVLDDLGMNLQFDINDWMIESEDDEKFVRFQQETLESIEEAQQLLENMLYTDEEDYDEEDVDEEDADDESTDTDIQKDAIIQILSSIKDNWINNK